MEDRSHNELGTIRISDEAIGVIAALAALEVPGVTSMAHGAVDGIVELLGVKPPHGRGVKVEVSEEEVYLELNLVVEFGVDIPGVCQKVQDQVQEAVEDMTGLSVARVNVSVQGVKARSERSAGSVNRTKV
jgi:uncharacterized alkaline shock family protein YloU